MRAGSTWVHSVLCALLRPEREDFVNSSEEAAAVALAVERCVLKAHVIHSARVSSLKGHLSLIEISRNFKDALISRALYCRNVRTAQGLLVSKDEQALIDRCRGQTEHDFLQVFFQEKQPLGDWLEEIIAHDITVADFRFTYELLLHNPHDQFQEWAEHFRLADVCTWGRIDAALRQLSFRQVKARSDAGVVGSTGVGRWMYEMDDETAASLEARYFRRRDERRRLNQTG